MHCRVSCDKVAELKGSLYASVGGECFCFCQRIRFGIVEQQSCNLLGSLAQVLHWPRKPAVKRQRMT